MESTNGQELRNVTLHIAHVVRRRIPNEANRSGYGYAYKWVCRCGAESRTNWNYDQRRWAERFGGSGKLRRVRVDRSAIEAGFDHERNSTQGPNRGKRKLKGAIDGTEQWH